MNDMDDTFSIGIKKTVYHFKLRQLRTERKLTQAETGKFCEMSVQQYSDIELLKQYPNEREALAIADLFEQDVHALFPKWSFPAYSYKRQDAVLEVKRVQLNAPEILRLEEPQDLEKKIDVEGLKEKIKIVLNTLSDRERTVLEERFGLVDGEPKTYDVVGRMFGVTRERIRQIEYKAMRKMRHPKRAKGLRDFLYDSEPEEKNE